jgi:murein DD-endopeptidase MepM/ murein hydrolase activator NlpD
MSGFDVRLAHVRRSRALTFAGAMVVTTVFAAGLALARFNLDGDAQAAGPDPVYTADAETAAPEVERAAPALLTGADLAALEHAAFAVDCRSCRTTRASEVRVRRGQTFASVLDAAGAGRVEAARAIAALDPYFSARDLRAGQTLTIYTEADTDGATRLAGLSFRPDSDRTLTVARVADDQFAAREAVAALEPEWVRATGEVESSLYLSAIDEGATDRIVVELANILGFAVDFRTIQPGDDFDILFERFSTRSGEVLRTGDIAYVRFDGRGDPKEYFRFTTPDGETGYYTAEGESAQRLLMLMPINGARISSSFGMRFHPVLQTNRPHNGTDFAAPRGTPIMAAGNGVVERANRFGSFGNYIRIRHANGYETAYAHLNGFARGIRAGSRVSQGQVIGYVGTTGRSTGPHLHYEVHKNGRPLNPMRLDLPSGRRLSEDELELFEAERDRILALRDGAPAADAPAEPAAAMLVANAPSPRRSVTSGGAQD